MVMETRWIFQDDVIEYPRAHRQHATLFAQMSFFLIDSWLSELSLTDLTYRANNNHKL